LKTALRKASEEASTHPNHQTMINRLKDIHPEKETEAKNTRIKVSGLTYDWFIASEISFWQHNSCNKFTFKIHNSNLGNKRSNKPRYSSYRRQYSSNNIDTKYKERGSSAHSRPQTAKETTKDSQNKYNFSFAFNSNCDYKNPEEFHKLRYSLASNEKAKRPSSAKRKDDNPLKSNEKEAETSHEYNMSSQFKPYNFDKNSFLDQFNENGRSGRPTKNEDYRFSQNELKKNKIYESRKSSHRESRKRSNSRDRSNSSPKSKYSRNYPQKSLNRSKSSKGKSVNKSIDKQSEKFMQKTKSSLNIGSSNKNYFHNTATLKFNNILKDMGAHCSTGHPSSFFNYSDKVKTRDMNVMNNSLSQNDYEKKPSKYSSNLESSIKPKNCLKQNEIFIMNANTNHHHHYHYNANAKQKVRLY
jgi:hypothetical protein